MDDKTLIMECEDIDVKIKTRTSEENEPDMLYVIDWESTEVPPIVIKPDPSSTSPEESVLIEQIKIEPDSLGPDPGDNRTGVHQESHTPEKSLEPALHPDLASSSHQQQEQYKSSTCIDAFSQSGHLQQHSITHTHDSTFKCSICDKYFGSPGHLKSHMVCHSVDKPHKCTVCDKAFSRAAILKQHQTIHLGEKQFKCTVCDIAFSRAGNLKQHQLIHTGETPFKCTICGKSFARAGALKQHQAIHSGEKPFKCTVCDNSFSRRGYLKQHQVIHSEEKSFKCKICDQSSSQASTLKQHQLIHSGEKPFKCAMCDKSYVNARGLRQHQRIHSGEELFKCNTCGKSSPSTVFLKQHQAVHSEEKLFKCYICSNCFPHAGSLKQYQVYITAAQNKKMRNHSPSDSDGEETCKSEQSDTPRDSPKGKRASERSEEMEISSAETLASKIESEQDPAGLSESFNIEQCPSESWSKDHSYYMPSEVSGTSSEYHSKAGVISKSVSEFQDSHDYASDTKPVMPSDENIVHEHRSDNKMSYISRVVPNTIRSNDSNQDNQLTEEHPLNSSDDEYLGE